MKHTKKMLSLLLSLLLLGTLMLPANAVTLEQESSETSFSYMVERAEALVNYEWIPQERIYTWNDNLYNGKNYFEAGETVKGVPYTLFSWELGFDGLLSLEQYKEKASMNYSTSAYCNSVNDYRVGPAYGNCCATLVSEVFGGNFMNGSNPRYDGVGTVQNSAYSITYKKVKLNAIQPGDALSCTSGAHIVWIGEVTDETLTIYESTPPVCRKVLLDKASHMDGNGYLVYNGNTYNIVTKSAEIIRDDLGIESPLSSMPTPLFAYTKSTAKTVVYDKIGGTEKANKIYGTDLCFIDAIFSNGWCHVNFPLDAGGLEHGYVKSSVFFDDGADMIEKTTKSSVPIYAREDFSNLMGRIAPESALQIVEETQTAIQVIYSLSTGGYKLGWISKEDLSKVEESPFLNDFCPIKGYPCVDENFVVQQSDYTTRGGEIYSTDYCTINAIYGDGWCQVTFPMDSGGERTAYTTLDHFLYDVNYIPIPYVTTENITVCPKKDLNASQNWWTGTGDTIYILGEYGDALQICYPIDDLYGGGYKLGWVSRESVSLPEQKELKQISVAHMPHKTEYQIGEILETDGLSVLLTYSDGSTDTISEGFTIDGFESNTAGVKTVTVSYGNQTTSFKVTVQNKSVSSGGKLKIGSSTVSLGKTVQVPVYVENTNLCMLTVTVNYDDSKLRYVSYSNSAFDMIDVNSSTSGKITFSAISESKDITNGEILILTFEVVAESKCDTQISVSVNDAYNERDEEQVLTVESGTINISEGLMGDVNGDNRVNIIDARWLLQVSSGNRTLTAEQQSLADVNGDGRINIIDARWLLQVSSGNREL